MDFRSGDCLAGEATLVRWLPEPRIGKHPGPVPSVHNSGWLKSPGLTALKEVAEDSGGTRKRLEKYVKAVLTRFANDKRVMAWDLYNEPANKMPVEPSHELLKLVFALAWEANPSQPLTSGICWGLVRGKTNTIWGWRTKEGAPEPKVWFHDVLHPDGTPYMPVEIEAIRQHRNP